jgi:four helix bundle protein
MVVKRVEDLHVWQRAHAFCGAIYEVLDRPGFLRDRRMRQQLSDASDSILSNIAEGFEQPTDRAFAKYLFTAKASTAEARARLRICCRRKYITEAELAAGNAIGDEVAKLATGLIKYLLRSDRRDRGLGARLPDSSSKAASPTNKLEINSESMSRGKTRHPGS